MRLDYWTLAVFAGLLLGGCGEAQGDLTDEMPEDLPAGQSATDGETDASTSGVTASSTTASGESSGGPLPACQSSEDCLGNDVCVASWDPETQTAGEPDCAFACIPSYDETQWCADAEACCDPEAICTARGYCVPPQEPGAADSSTGGESTGSTGGDSTGTGGEG
ncbi:MAG: hypothetical protein KUG77_22660 [Nannocystaceae bacterium]|nr:hypothetical protein [Nannocystaceae bacterium]